MSEGRYRFRIRRERLDRPRRFEFSHRRRRSRTQDCVVPHQRRQIQGHQLVRVESDIPVHILGRIDQIPQDFTVSIGDRLDGYAHGPQFILVTLKHALKGSSRRRGVVAGDAGLHHLA